MSQDAGSGRPVSPVIAGATSNKDRTLLIADDDAAFRKALAALHLDAAADLFLDHFGAGEQTAVRFEMAHFTRSFHAVFVRCRERGVQLHPNFVPLGVYLAALYEHLEGLDVPLDVRAAFAAAST